jgi:iron complex outermembrane receptor protein
MFRKPLVAMALAIVSLCSIANESALRAPDLIIELDRIFNSKAISQSSVRVLTRKDIESLGAQNLAELLNEIPFVTSTMDSVGNGTTAVADIGGFGETAQNNTQVFVNGIRLNNSTLEAPNLSLVPLTAIDKIEVHTGSASARYGDGAVGGAINIITNTHPTEPYDKVHSGVSSFGGGKLAAEGARNAGQNGSIDYAVEYFSSDGYRDHTERDLNYGTLSFKRNIGETRQLIITATGTYADQLTSGAASAATLRASRTGLGTTLSSTEKNSTLLSASLRERAQTFDLTTSLSTRRSNQEANFFSTPSGESFEFADQETVSSQFNFEATRELGLIRSVGYEVEKSTFLKTQDFFTFGTSTTDVSRSLQSIYSTISAFDRDKTRAFVTARHAKKKDERAAEENENTSHNAFGFVLERDSHFTDQGTLFLSLDNGYRFATFDENSSTTTGEFLPTQNHSARRIGYNSSNHHLSLYQLIIDDEIRLVDPANFQNGTYDQTKRFGLDANLKFAMRGKRELVTSYSFLKTEITSGTDTGKEIPMVPQHSLKIRYTAPLSGLTKHSFSLHSQSGTFPLNDTSNVTDRSNQYTTLDYNIEYQLAGLRVSGGIQNVLNEEYDLYRIISASDSTILNRTPAAERAFSLTLQYVF